VFRLDAAEQPDAELQLSCKVGDIVGLLPFGGDAHGVTTSGLQWALSNETLAVNSSRGISNRATREEVVVSLQRGRLLVTMTDGATYASA
jgi:thiamine pyrophosphokinase